MFLLSNLFIIRYVLMFLIAMLIAPFLSVADGTMNLKQSVTLALEHNRMLAAAQSRRDKADADADVATAKLLPRLDISTGASRTDSPLGAFGSKLLQSRITAADFAPAALNNPGYINNYQSRLGLSMPVFAGGALWAGRARARHHADAAALNYQFQQQQMMYQVTVAYVQVRQTHERQDAASKAVQAASKRWQDAMALNKRGMAIKSDVMDAHVHLLRSELDLEQANAAYADSIEAFARILGRDQPLAQPVLSEPVVHRPSQSLEQLLEGMYEHRADLQALQNEVKAAEAGKRQSKSGYLPQVSLMAAQEWNNERFGLKNRNNMIGATVSVNLFAGGGDRARVRAAESESLALEFQLMDKQQQISNEIRQAWRSLRTAEKRLASENEALTQTSESLRIKSLRYNQGLEKTSDVLDAQARMDASRVASIRAKYDVVVARAALLLAAGKLDEGVIE